MALEAANVVDGIGGLLVLTAEGLHYQRGEGYSSSIIISCPRLITCKATQPFSMNNKSYNNFLLI